MSRPLAGAWIFCAAGLSMVATAALAQTAPALTQITLDAQQQAALGVHTTPVQPARQQQLLASATVTVPPGQEVTVAAPFAGVIARIDAGLGDSVSAGAPLAILHSPALADARRQLREAELQACNAQAALLREQAMHDEGVIPAARLETTRNRHLAAQASWQAHRSALKASGLGPSGDYASGQIVAPRGGAVIDVRTSVGQRIEAGTVLFHIADLRQLQLDITLSGEKAARLRAGDVVSIPSHDARAVLLGVSHSLDASQQARARARVTVPGRLQAGQALQVQLQPAVAVPSPAVWQVPARALLQLHGQTWVLVATATGYTPAPVLVLSSNDDSATVQGPLNPQQRVVSTGLGALRPLLQKAD